MPQPITPSIFFRLSKSYSPTMSAEDLYNFTRGRWRIDLKKAKDKKLAFAFYDKKIVAVYEIESWHPADSTEPKRNPDINPALNTAASKKRRSEFVGRPASQEFQDKFIGKPIPESINLKSSSSFFYVNLAL